MISKEGKLTPLAVNKILASDAEDENVIVQIYAISSTKTGKLLCNISDGQNFTKGFLNADQGITADDEFAIISIKSHVVLKSNVGVTSFRVLTKQKALLGSPVAWSSAQESQSQMQEEKEFKFQRILKTETKKIQLSTPSTATTTATANKKSSELNEYQLIDDLYIGQNRWTILCRITRKTFKESLKKGTKILQIQLVDKSKKKILGTFFNEAAVEFNDYLKEGSIYEISKGRIIEGDYNNSRNEKLSSTNLIFDLKSQFNEVSDVNIISKSEDSAITLGQVYKRRILNQEYDVVAYVVEVRDQTTFQKDDKSKTIKEVLLADPKSQITMVVRLWGWREQFGNEMVGKVLIFSRFSLKEYKQSIFLNNGIRSCIIKSHGHAMKDYEGQNVDVSSFTNATQTQEKVEEDTSNMALHTKDLSNKIRYMNEGETVKSILNVWINRIALGKKWNYDACPKCKKSAEKYSKCAHCEEPIQETKLSFVMGVEVSDFYGSIWITALDELAKNIFYDMGNTAALQIQQLSKDKDVLAETLEKYLYQPFRMKVFTKKDHEGRIKHNAFKLSEFNEQKIARANIGQIKELMAVRA